MATDGVHRATVTDSTDPQGLGRVKVEAARGPAGGAWAPVTTPAAPATGDEVLIAFEDGDRARPLVIGSLRRDALELRFGASIVRLRPDGVVQIDDAGGSAITLQPSGITISSPAKVELRASQVQVSAGMLTVDAAMSRFSGVVQCDTLVANAVVAQSYTPGAGNLA